MSHDIVVIGASAGGVESLKRLFARLPGNFNAAVFVTLHISPSSQSRLPSILTAAGLLRAHHPVEGESIEPGKVYIAPPDRHLLLRPSTVHLSHGPKENGTRPAADPMFRSAARVFGARVIGVVLSGTLDDGSAGLTAIKARGGITIAQDPASALFPDMPANAIAGGAVQHVVVLDEIAPMLVRLTGDRSGPSSPITAQLQAEEAMAELDLSLLKNDAQPGTATDYTCPDCGGVLRLLNTRGGAPHFRCHVGHAWAVESLQAAQIERVEQSLWAALRILDENGKLMRQMRDSALERNLHEIARGYQDRLEDVNRNIAALRKMLFNESDEMIN